MVTTPALRSYGSRDRLDLALQTGIGIDDVRQRGPSQPISRPEVKRPRGGAVLLGTGRRGRVISLVVMISSAGLSLAVLIPSVGLVEWHRFLIINRLPRGDSVLG